MFVNEYQVDVRRRTSNFSFWTSNDKTKFTRFDWNPCLASEINSCTFWNNFLVMVMNCLHFYVKYQSPNNKNWNKRVCKMAASLSIYHDANRWYKNQDDKQPKWTKENWSRFTGYGQFELNKIFYLKKMMTVVLI